MKTLKLSVLPLIFLMALTVEAQTMSGYLDFSRMAAKTDAGQYFVGLGLNPAAAGQIVISTSLEHPYSDDHSDPMVCVTHIQINAGSYSFVMTDANKDESMTSNYDLQFSAYHWDDSADCTSPEKLLSVPLTYSAYLPLGGIELKYLPPRNYTRIVAAMSAMPYGTTIVLSASKSANGTFAVENLKKQLADQLKRNDREALYYNVYAEDEAFAGFELGRGYIELK